jgi:hypothetical protein
MLGLPVEGLDNSALANTLLQAVAGDRGTGCDLRRPSRPRIASADLAVPRYSADIVETENDATITFLVVEPAFI